MSEVVPAVELEAVRQETPPAGLDAAAVRLRVEQGLTNAVEERTSRTFTEILKANVRELAAWRPPPLEATAAYRRSEIRAPLEARATIRPQRESERDEVDRLFRSLG